MGQSKLKLHKTAAEPPPGVPEDDGLSAFATEADKGARAAAPAVKNPWSGKHVPLIAAGFAAVLIAGASTAAYIATRPGTEPSATAATQGGTAIIDSRPSGAAILIDGIAQGTTPAKLPLTVGRHTLELNADGNSRTFTLDIEAGATISHYVELAPAVAPVTTGRLEVASDPPGAQVTINGTSRGRTPVAVADLPPGELTVAIASGQTTVNRRVTITAGNTASVFASLGAPDAAAGWLTIKSPIDLEIFEAKRLIGTTASDRLMMPAGRHDLELVNTALQFRRSVSVQVGAGATVTTAVDVPNGTLSVNALPWAEVFIAGKSLGTTPLGNVALPIGSYEVLWRHPQLGERKRTVTVVSGTPVRVGVDFNQ